MVLKKILYFFLCFDCLIWTWTWLGLEPLWTWTWLGLEPLWTRSWLGLDSPGLGLVLDSTKVDLTTALLICNQMHMKNNAIINNIQHVNENCLMLPCEMSIQEVAKDCASFGGADGSDLLQCFDHCTEYDALFDKNLIFSAFCSKCCFFMKLT